jgi:hypothetical protein
MVARKIVGVAMVCLGVAANTFGNLIAFDLFGDPAIYSVLHHQVSGSVTNSGLIATLTASEGWLNRSTAGFGINGVGSDETSALNAGQFIDIVFNQTVTFSNLNVSSWGSSNAGGVELRTTNIFTSAHRISGRGDSSFNIEVNTNQTIRILAITDTTGGSGFSVDRFTVAIPEPAVVTFIALTGLGLLIGRRFL